MRRHVIRTAAGRIWQSDLDPMIELLVTYPGLVFIGLSLLVVIDTMSGNLPPAALVPFALGTVLAVILL